MRNSNAVSLRPISLEWSDLLKQYLALRRAEGLASGSIAIYERYASEFFKVYPDALSTPDRLRECVYDHLGKEHLGPVVYNMRRRFVGAFLEFMRLEGYIPENPSSRFKARREPGRIVVIKPDVLRQLLDAPETDTFAGVRDRTMFLVMLDCGIRPQEIRKLLPDDVDLEEGVIHVRREVSKTKQERILPLSAPSLLAIRKLLFLRPPEWEGAFLFCCEDGQPLKGNTLARNMFKYRQKIGASNLPPYALRHTFATTMMKNGASMDTIRQMMGHANFNILKTYMHLTNDDVRREHEAHSPLLSLLPQPTRRVRRVRE